MENSEQKISMIDRLVENEKKAKTWTAFTIGLALIMGLLVVFFSQRLSQTRSALFLSQDSLVNAQNRLKELNDSINRVKDSIAQQNYQLTRELTNLDSVKSINDTLTVLLNQTQSGFINTDPALATQKINELYKEAFPQQHREVSKYITESIIQTKNLDQVPAKKPVIYLQCMPAFAEQSRNIIGKLKEKRIPVQGPEIITGFTFDAVIKYYRDEDKALADKIAAQLNEGGYTNLKKEFAAEKEPGKPALNQVEIWIGNYRKPDLDKLIQAKIKTKAYVKE